MSLGTQYQLNAFTLADDWLNDAKELDLFQTSPEDCTRFQHSLGEYPLKINFGETTHISLPKNTDMWGNAYLHVKLPTTLTPDVWKPGVGLAMIASFMHKLDAYVMTFHSGTTVQVHNQLLCPHDKLQALEVLQGGTPLPSMVEQDLWIPLPTWWQGTYLPVIAMTNCVLDFALSLAPSQTLLTGGTPVVGQPTVALCLDQYRLSEDERFKFMAAPLSRVFVQPQTLKASNYTFDSDMDIQTTSALTFDLTALTGATQMLVWTCEAYQEEEAFRFRDYVKSARLVINGVDYEPERPAEHLKGLIPLFCCPNGVHSANIYVYSFCLNAGMRQPTGNMPFDKCTSCSLILTLAQWVACTVTLTAYTYNRVDIAAGTASAVFI